MPVSFLNALNDLEQALGYTFKNKGLLSEALTHKSFHNEHPEDAPLYNERLELLGDSVISLMIIEYLFGLDAGYPESVMSKLKSYIVKGTVLSEIAGDISLGTYIRVGKGEEAAGGRNKKSITADAFEAVIGAVYLDGGIASVREVIHRLFKDRLDALIQSGSFYDYKTELQEATQTRFGSLPDYRLASEEGAEHRKTFTVEVFIKGKSYGKGQGKSKKDAQAQAAKEAIKKLGGKGA